MKFAEVPVDSEKINTMFGKTMLYKYIAEVREDFEKYHSEMTLDEENGNTIEDLQHYKTELFSTFFLGVLSTIDKESNFNIAVIRDMKG